jgi:hypothetical protein
MNKKLKMTACFMMLGLMSVAQNKPEVKSLKIGAGISLAIPANNLPLSSIGTGIDLLAQYGLSEDLSVTADAGYTALFGKNAFPHTGVVPLRVGFRYFPLEQVYLAAKIGAGIYTLSNTNTSYTAYAVGAGYNLSEKIDVSASYDGFTRKFGSFGYAAIRLGYTF